MATLEQFRAMLHIDKHRLDDELEIQAETQERIGAEVARLNTRAIEAKDELARVEARLIEDYRDEKSTKDLAEAKARRHPDRTRAWERYQAARELHEVWSSLHSAWVTKGYKLADLGALYGSDYFTVRTVTRPDRDYVTRRELANGPDTREAARGLVQRGRNRL